MRIQNYQSYLKLMALVTQYCYTFYSNEYDVYHVINNTFFSTKSTRMILFLNIQICLMRYFTAPE